jgi:anaerobic selenocysteine-containing dehydrogenase
MSTIGVDAGGNLTELTATPDVQAVEAVIPGACPLDCPDGCSWLVTVRGGEAVRLQGNPDHPFTHGALCAKVARYLDHTRTPDRLLHPLRRIGRKGEGRFERISWDDALGEIAERLLDVRDRLGGEAIWPFQGTGTLGYLQGLEGRSGARLWNVLGASDHLMTICSIAGSDGLRYTTGSNRGMDPEALQHARLILLWGSNPLTSHHHIWKFIGAARKQGAHLVVIDPVRTRSAAQADEHLAPRPGTDAALALGLMHEVVARGAHDEAFLRERCVGWHAYQERLAQFPPERVAEICDLPVERIVALGRRLAATRPTAIRATMGIQRHAGGGMALRTLATIPAVTGDWALPGGGLAYSTSGYFRGDRKALVRDDLRPHPVRSLAMTRLGDVLLKAEPPVHALVIYGANPLASNPDTEKVRRALARNDLFTVVIEQVPTDTVDYADIVLPSTMQTEHTDVHDGYGHMYLAWNEPAVEPPGECLAHTEIFRRLARAMGLSEPALYEDDLTLARTLIESGHPTLEGITVERLRRDGWVRIGHPHPLVPFASGFPTPSGKLELYSERAAADGHDPLPGYVPPAEAASPGEGRLALIAAASHWFLNSTFANAPEQRRRAGEPTVALHPDDALARGLAAGDRVRVGNERGSFEAILAVGEAARRGVAATTKGHWPKLLTGRTNVNAATEERDADLGCGAVFHDCSVWVRPASSTGERSGEVSAAAMA